MSAGQLAFFGEPEAPRADEVTETGST